MTVVLNDLTPEAAAIIHDGGVGIVRTDTLYGIVARADTEAAVERVFSIKGRTPTKSPIVLIASTEQLFNRYDKETLDRLLPYWPGKNSIILPSDDAPAWLTRGNASVAYRMPDNEALRRFIELTGPLIAPSANPEGQPPAMTIAAAHTYFGEAIDVYIDSGEVTDETPSRLLRLLPEGMERLR